MSMALLVGLVSTYSIRAWHHPELHHHASCDAKNELHFHLQDKACSLCDFVFSFSLPVTSGHSLQSILVLPEQAKPFFWINALPGNVRTGFSLRGPPVLV